MRITSGLFKSRIIREPRHIRPTQDKVREALFDVLRLDVADSNFLELFAGSGAVGIEALSNGAKEVVFVEKDKRCCKIIENNLAQLGLMPNEQATDKKILILATDAFRAVDIFYREQRKFDIIFLDPPYYPACSYSLKRYCGIPKSHRSSSYIRDKSLAKKVLQRLAACDILAPHGLIVVEHSKKDFIEASVLAITSFKQKRYGDTILSFYEKERKS